MGNKLFGTDGVRGVANVYPMTADFAFKLAQAAASTFKKEKARVAVARDTRVSGQMLEAALTAGFTAQGVDVLLLGVVPTPALAFLAPSMNVDMAVMISASHNPYHDNGIKLIDGQGKKLTDEKTAEIEALVAKGEFLTDKDKIGVCYNEGRVIENYVSMVKKIAPAGSLKGVKIVLDCANGAFSDIAPEILRHYGADLVVVANEPDGYNINKDCGSQHTDMMRKTVVEQGADIGIAVDGDGDRIIVCDEKGAKLDGDQIIAFLGQYFQKEGRLKGGAVVATVWSNLGLEKYLRTLGVGYHRTAVGERYVIDKMNEIGANVGGEESGHMVLRDFAPTGDGLIAGINVCLGLKKSGRKMSEIFPVFVKEPCLVENIRFDNKEKIAKAMDDAHVREVIENCKQAMAGTGSVIVRKSGTEPLIKIRVESENADKAAENMNILRSEISKFC